MNNNCINCNLRLRFQRQYTLEATNIRKVISKWIDAPVPETAALCHICWTAANSDDPEPPSDRNYNCVMCGRSVIKERNHQLSQQNEKDSEIYSQVKKLTTFRVSEQSKVCHSCYKKALQRTSFSKIAPKRQSSVKNEPPAPKFSINDLCRVCLLQKDDMVSIFNEEDDIQQKIQYCTGLQVTNDINRPSKICTTCNSDLTSAFQFKTNYINSDDRLSKFLNVKDIKKQRTVSPSSASTSINKQQALSPTPASSIKKQRPLSPTPASNIKKQRPLSPSSASTSINNQRPLSPTPASPTTMWQRLSPTPASYTAVKQVKEIKKELEIELHLEDDPELDVGSTSVIGNLNEEVKVEIVSDEQFEMSEEVLMDWNELDGTDEYLSKYFPDESSPKSEDKIEETPKPVTVSGPHMKTCKVCSETFTDTDKYQTHMLTHWKKIYKCEQCDDIFGGTKSRRFHVLKHSGPVFGCKMCFYRTNDQTKLEKHLLITKHSGNTRKWKPTCKVCKEQFTSINERNEHFKYEHLAMAWHCDVCNKVVYDEKSEHEHEEVPVKEVKKKECEICGSKFDSRPDLLAHMKQHNSDYWICPVCGIYSAGYMRGHMLKHRNDKFECDHCGGVFRTKSGLTKHIKNSHLKTYSKIYQCDICKRIVSNAHCLRHHIKRVHLNERNFKCLECGAMKYSAELLRQHMYKHNGIKELKCELCKSEFARITYLKTHMLKEHGVAVPNCKRMRLYNQSLEEFIREYLVSIGRINPVSGDPK